MVHPDSPGSPVSFAPLPFRSSNFVPLFAPHSGKSAPPTSLMSAPVSGWDERLLKITLVKHGEMLNAARSTVASAKSLFAIRLSVAPPLTSLHVLWLLVSVGSQAGMFHGGA